MRPEADNPLEAGGVLNPGGARAKDGSYILFPRLVAPGNFSRIGAARMTYDSSGVPIGVERLGVALEPREPYEMNDLTGGGVEDPRVVYVPLLGSYVMTYVAYGPIGPRAAMAVSRDLVSWDRLGLIDFAPLGGADMSMYANKDHVLFPEPVPGPDGRLSLALIHRPCSSNWICSVRRSARRRPTSRTFAGANGSRFARSTILIGRYRARPKQPHFGDHSLLIAPHEHWESSRIGAGTPPVRLPQGWLTMYHGVEFIYRADGSPGLRYSAAALLLDADDPRRVLYRSPTPTLEPLLPEECAGVVSNVVFPTALDLRETYIDVYYGMADRCIGAARMQLPQ